MKRRLAPRFAFFFAGLGPAAIAAPLAGAEVQLAPGPGSPASPDAPPPPLYAAPQLDQLLGPIALYPDPLIALILPASTSPGDIVSTAAYLGARGDPNQDAQQPWSDSVKGLAHYPVVVEWMAQNLIWTQALGAAFANQPGDVMQAIQRLRSEALATGTLTDTPPQRVVEEDGLIEILPAEADVIYVPVYNPEVVYLGGYYGGPPLAFGTPYPAGVWLTNGFDWRQRTLWIGNGRFAHNSRGWQVPDLAGAGGHRWQPPANRPRAVPLAPGTSVSVARPHPMTGDFFPRRPVSPPARSNGRAADSRFPTPLPRPSLPPEARGTPPAGFRPVNPPPGSPANSPMYSDVRGAVPPGRPFRPAVRSGPPSSPSTASPSAAEHRDHAADRPAPKPAAPAPSPSAENKDSDSAKH